MWRKNTLLEVGRHYAPATSKRVFVFLESETSINRPGAFFMPSPKGRWVSPRGRVQVNRVLGVPSGKLHLLDVGCVALVKLFDVIDGLEYTIDRLFIRAEFESDRQ